MNLNNHYEVLDIIFKELPFLFWKDINGVYLGVNENQAKEFGLTREDIIGKTIFEILNDYDAAQVINYNDNMIMNEGKKVIVEETIIKSDGEFTYLSQKTPVFDRNNNVIGLLGFSLDITYYKKQLNLEQEKFKQCINTIQNTLLSYKFNMLNSIIGVKSADPSERVTLSTLERDILYLVSMGKQAKEISGILSKLYGKNLASSTVAGVINKRLYRKLEVSNTSKLIEKAYILGLIPFMPDTFLES